MAAKFEAQRARWSKAGVGQRPIPIYILFWQQGRFIAKVISIVLQHRYTHREEIGYPRGSAYNAGLVRWLSG
jgi:hypothetical protein